MIDDSSTAIYAAKALKEKKNLTVITNSVELVVELSDVDGWTVMSTGGRLKPDSLCLVGTQPLEMIRSYHVDTALISCKGVDVDAGITDSSEYTAHIKQSMLRAAKKRILILDGTKFDKVSFVEIGALSCVDTVVTNVRPSDAWMGHFEALGIRVLFPA